MTYSPELRSSHFLVWADHADYISKAYSGTGALKTDFTRTGVRSKQGLLMDGQNSVVRYLKNNYLDGDRQVCQETSSALNDHQLLVSLTRSDLGRLRFVHWCMDPTTRTGSRVIYHC